MTSQPDQSAGGAAAIDPTLFMAGDEVAIRFVVTRDYDPEVGHVETEAATTGFRANFLPCDVMAHNPKPRPLAPGDRVWSPKLSSFGELLAIRDDMGWVQLTGLTPRTLNLFDLERASVPFEPASHGAGQ